LGYHVIPLSYPIFVYVNSLFGEAGVPEFFAEVAAQVLENGCYHVQFFMAEGMRTFSA